jgi:DNA-binding transcriptional MerR regulator
MELTIDELASRTQLPVRTLREYHSMRLLPPPERRGRIGVYGAEHVERLALIGRLQRRGYSLAGIKDLLAAWDAGADLTTLLGVDSGPAALDETPLQITGADLRERVPVLNAAATRQAVAAGLLVPLGKDHFLVRSPALLALVADGVRAGVPLPAMLDVIAGLTRGIGTLADEVAGHVVEQIAPPLAAAGDAAQLQGLLQRWRVLLPQGVASILADRLGAALLAKAEGEPAGEQLRAAIGRIRVGATTDTAGTIRHHPPGSGQGSGGWRGRSISQSAQQTRRRPS